MGVVYYMGAIPAIGLTDVGFVIFPILVTDVAYAGDGSIPPVRLSSITYLSPIYPVAITAPEYGA